MPHIPWPFSVRQYVPMAGTSSDDEDESDPMELKRLANAAYKDSRFGEALKFYTLALLKMPDVDTPENLEMMRILLANRGQTYHVLGDLHTALRDIKLALSPDLTTPDSPKALTLKCRFRRAKLLVFLMRLDDCRKECETIMDVKKASKIDMDVTKATLLGRALDMIARNTPGRDGGWKEKLTRAVDARGLILMLNDRGHFPFPPGTAVSELHPRPGMSEVIVNFIKNDGLTNLTSTSDLALAPLAYPVVIVAPYFAIPPPRAHSLPSFFTGGPPQEDYISRNRTAVREDVPISSFLDKHFAGVVSDNVGGKVSDEELRQREQDALDHDDPSTSIVIVHTTQGRMFIVPRTATIKEIIAGCRWPRENCLPFKDLRKRPRRCDDPLDGMELMSGNYLEFYVIPKAQLRAYIDYMGKKYRFTRVGIL